jgi:hypothetical protein
MKEKAHQSRDLMGMIQKGVSLLKAHPITYLYYLIGFAVQKYKCFLYHQIFF